ncbi:MAG TPA: copper transporter, partial [Mycobacteriales bacterium]|nr:copper transporter [Mycobacteriales bacterium]
MIDFRYHVVSLAAVFLALALGVLLGTTQLSGAVSDDLRGQVRQLDSDKRDLQAELRSLQGRARSDDTVTAALAPRLVAGALRDAKVVLVATPQAADSTVDGVQQAVEQAGGRVTGRVQLTDDYADPRRAADAKAYVTGGGQPAGFQLPESEDAGVLSGALLSYGLLGSREGDPTPAVTSEVVAGFASLRMLRVDSAQVTPADLAVVVTSGAVPGEDPAARLRTLGDLVSALDGA